MPTPIEEPLAPGAPEAQLEVQEAPEELQRTDTAMPVRVAEFIDLEAGVQEGEAGMLTSARGPVVGAMQSPRFQFMNLVFCVLIVGMLVVLGGSGFFWWTPIFRE